MRVTVAALLSLALVGLAVQPDTGERPEIPPAGEVHPDVHLATPLPGEEVSSPLTVVGEARGVWYFEGSFAIRLFDLAGRELAVAVAQAQGPWMTEGFVPFTAELTFDAPSDTCLVMELEKANPSDLRRLDDAVRVGLGCVLEK